MPELNLHYVCNKRYEPHYTSHAHVEKVATEVRRQLGLSTQRALTIENLASIDKLKAIVAIEAGTYQDLCAFVDVAPARYFEWVSGKIEPKAQTVLMIQKWIANRESEMGPMMKAEYEKEIKNVRKS